MGADSDIIVVMVEALQLVFELVDLEMKLE